ncbi:Glycosyl transferases group 1 [Aquisphaera giovannonii]|uniref:Glycosyl transferases group 1 n=1 Tax=Aquisphaera giovannonii TaxID=406548 RepID=A0A5B9W210_9BACT|nr:glycosyltransferase [Aquisphaera giovannonii]QEH34568.1 Glycosyl transferases group 1 [Aquisphaera giovannonii]
MDQEPLHVLWIEPSFPGRLGAMADWLVRRRGYRGWFFCHTAEPREDWPASAGQGLEVQTFGVGGVAREASVTWSRTLERSLCYSYGCWEVLESRRPRPVDLIVGRSAMLGSSLFAPVYAPSPPRVGFFDYYVHARANDLADEDAAGAPAAYSRWRRSVNAIDLLDLESADLPWTPTRWQRHLYPREYRDPMWVQHDGVATPRDPSAVLDARAGQPRRTLAGRTLPEGTRVVSFAARTLDRLRGFDRFWTLANAILRARRDVVCAIVGGPVVERGLDVHHHGKDYAAGLRAEAPAVDPERTWFLGRCSRATTAEVLSASDLHIAPGRPYPVARSLLEAMGRGCVVLASDTAPHREVITPGRDGLLADPGDPDSMLAQALAVLDDPDGHRPLGEAAAETVRSRYSREACLPRIAERFAELAASRRRG